MITTTAKKGGRSLNGRKRRPVRKNLEGLSDQQVAFLQRSASLVERLLSTSSDVVRHFRATYRGVDFTDRDFENLYQNGILQPVA